MTFWVDRVSFDDILLPLRIYKARGLCRADVLQYFSAQENRRLVIDRFDELEPLSLAEALQLTHFSQRLIALRSFDKETVLAHPEATRLDRQSIAALRSNSAES